MATAIKNVVQNILPNGAKINGHTNGLTNGSVKRPIKIAGCSGGTSVLLLHAALERALLIIFVPQASMIESGRSMTWQRTRTLT
jgi:hypothetical protein